MGNRTKRWRIITISAVVVLIVALALPISNLLIGRKYLPVAAGDEQFQQVSMTLQKSCADCHVPDGVQRPIYFSFPIASSVIAADMKAAMTYFVMTPEQLEGKEPFNAAQVAKLQKVVADGSMPPGPYLAMHWNAGLGDEQTQQLTAYIDSVPGGYGPQPIPVENPFHPDPAKVALGEKLFHDVLLSGDDTLSCASCHGLDTGGVDRLVTSTGIRGQHGPINAPTVYNAAFNFAQFWDGRAADLQAQAAGPVVNPLEMGADWDNVCKKLAADEQCAAAFKKLYDGQITTDTATDAIAEFEKTLLTPGSKFDKYLAGDEQALDAQEQQGYKLFVAHDCATCHTGVNLGGLTYERMGLKRDYFAERGGPLTEADQGRFNVTKVETDRHKFKTPTLRNVALTWPYFHDGSAKTLADAVRTMMAVQCDIDCSDEDTAALVAFLNTMTGEYNGKPLTETADADAGAEEPGA